MQDIWKLEKHSIWSGIVYFDHSSKTTWRLFHGKQKEQVRLLKCIQTVCCLANFMYSLFNGKMVQMVRRACWYPLSSTDPSNISQTRKITCYV